jgi:hypothetical protein
MLIYENYFCHKKTTQFLEWFNRVAPSNIVLSNQFN